jgi:hypothetical protein
MIDHRTRPLSDERAKCRLAADLRKQLRPARGGDLTAQEGAPLSRHLLQPQRPLGAIPGFQFPAQARRQPRAGTAGGHCNLEQAAPHHCRIDEVAVVGVVHGIAQDARQDAGPKYRRVDARCRGCRNRQERMVHIRGSEFPPEPVDLPVLGQLPDRTHGPRTDHRYLRAVLQQSLNLVGGNRACACNQAPPFPEIDEQREEQGRNFRRLPVRRSLDRTIGCANGRALADLGFSPGGTRRISTHLIYRRPWGPAHLDVGGLQRSHNASVTAITVTVLNCGYVSSRAFEAT